MGGAWLLARDAVIGIYSFLSSTQMWAVLRHSYEGEHHHHDRRRARHRPVGSDHL